MVCLPPPQNCLMGEGGRLGLARAARDARAEANATTKTGSVTLLPCFTLLPPARRRIVGAPSARPQEGCHARLPTRQGCSGWIPRCCGVPSDTSSRELA